jgi:hypothetical protein
MNRKRLALLWLFYAAVCAAPFVGNHPLPGSTVYSAPGAIAVGMHLNTVAMACGGHIRI